MRIPWSEAHCKCLWLGPPSPSLSWLVWAGISGTVLHQLLYVVGGEQWVQVSLRNWAKNRLHALFPACVCLFPSKCSEQKASASQRASCLASLWPCPELGFGRSQFQGCPDALWCFLLLHTGLWVIPALGKVTGLLIRRKAKTDRIQIFLEGHQHVWCQYHQLLVVIMATTLSCFLRTTVQ